MKTYLNLAAFEKRVQRTTDWDDYFILGGRMYKLYEYGGGSMFHMPYDYCYWVNKKTHDAIYLKYHCPATDWKKIPEVCKKNKIHRFVKGDRAHGNMDYCTKCGRTEREQVQTRTYQFLSLEFIPSMELWRTDTL